MYNPKVYLTDSKINNQKNGPVVKNIFFMALPINLLTSVYHLNCITLVSITFCQYLLLNF